MKSSDNHAVYLLAHTYLDRNGKGLLFSGVQRYIRELCKVFLARNVRPVVIQKANRPFETQTDGVAVIGLSAGETALADPGFNVRAHRLIPPDAPVIYCVLELGNPIVRPNSIAIQHGLWWSGAYASWKFPIIRWINRRVLRTSRAVICVDTNYINWCLSVLRNPQTLISKCHYIPNFVDPVEFPREVSPEASDNTSSDLPVVLFPRRCALERGALLFLESCLLLWSTGYRFLAKFCGFGDLKEMVRQTAAARGYSDRVQISEVSFTEMAGVYRRATVVVVPSIWCEGTSLSCIEAMYLGKPVIATTVGGLPNLIIPGYNGELVLPQPDKLAAAIAKLLSSPPLRALYGQRAMEVSSCLTVDRWRQSVGDLITTNLHL